MAPQNTLVKTLLLSLLLGACATPCRELCRDADRCFDATFDDTYSNRADCRDTCESKIDYYWTQSTQCGSYYETWLQCERDADCDDYNTACASERLNYESTCN